MKAQAVRDLIDAVQSQFPNWSSQVGQGCHLILAARKALETEAYSQAQAAEDEELRELGQDWDSPSDQQGDRIAMFRAEY